MAGEVRVVDALRAEIKNLDSKVELLEEKIKTIENQNVTLANTIFKLNERLKSIESGGGSSGQAQATRPRTSAETSSAGSSAGNENLEKIASDLDELKKEVMQMKYTIGMINPLDFVTTRQVNELVKEAVNEKIEQMRKKK